MDGAQQTLELLERCEAPFHAAHGYANAELEPSVCPEPRPVRSGAGGVRKTLAPAQNKFHKGNGDDGKHYWLTPPDLMAELQTEFQFTFDACPYPKPADFDGLTCEWGESVYANIPFGSIIHEGKKKGPTAWMRKAIAENRKGKRVVVVYPVDKWILMMLAAGAKVRNLGDVRWCATEDGSQGKGTGRHIAAFILGHGEPEIAAKMEAAEAMARAVDALVECGRIDARSALADARLRFGQPFEHEVGGGGAEQVGVSGAREQSGASSHTAKLCEHGRDGAPGKEQA